MADHDNDLAADLAVGALAGAIGVWALDRLDWAMWNRESAELRARTRMARPGGLDPAHVIAKRTAALVPNDLNDRQIARAGDVVHFMLGATPGMLYGALRQRLPWIRAGRGALFGASLFLLQDEGINTIAGFGGRPQDYPWQDHARGIVAHTVFGMVTDAVLSLFQDRGRDDRPGSSLARAQ